MINIWIIAIKLRRYAKLNITQLQMNEINHVQLNIFKDFIKVCDKLNIKYYAVHGTLLGALKYGGFFPFDDDIDVAMMREDYDKFISEGQTHLKKGLFIQSSRTEIDYPLSFAKIRDENTAFIQPILDGFDVSKGIYIDIFPIDNYPNNGIKLKKINLIERFYSIRVNTRFISVKRNLKQRIASRIIKMISPSWHKASIKLSEVYKSQINTGKVIVYGGKKSEINIPLDWFGEGIEMKFEDISIRVPSMYEKYLRQIYGDYKCYSPSAKLMVSDKEVKISARVYDVNKSYIEYQ